MKFRRLLFLVLITCSLFSVLYTVSAGITLVDAPPLDLGLVYSLDTVELSFTASLTGMATSSAQVVVQYPSDAFAFSGYSVYLDAANVTDQFELTESLGAVEALSLSVSPPNGFLHVTVVLNASLVSGSYEVDWTYNFGGDVGSPPMPVAPVWGSGVSQVDVKTLYTLNLDAGWNLVSLPVAPDDPSISEVLGALPSYEVQGWSGSTYTYPTLFEAGKGYWVRVDAPAVVPVEGAPVMELGIELQKGFNLVGAPIVSTPSEPCFTGFYQMASWTGSRYESSEYFEPGVGYWVLVMTAKSITVPAP